MANNPIDKIIGANLKQKRRECGMSQEGIAEACIPPVRAQQISKFELGKDRISSSQLVALARAMHIPVSEFFVGVEEMLPPPEEATQQDMVLMKNFKSLSASLQDSVRVMVSALAKELAAKYTDLRA